MIGQAVDVNTRRVLASTRQVRDAVAGRRPDDAAAGISGRRCAPSAR